MSVTLTRLIVIVSMLRNSLQTSKSVELQVLQNERDCFCYSREKSISCYCEREVNIKVSLFRKISIYVTCVDGATTQVDPYRYLSFVDLRAFFDKFRWNDSSLNFYSIGCPPPERGYSSLGIWIGDRVVSIGRAAPKLELTIICGNTSEFQLKGHHLGDFDNLSDLVIECPSLNRLPWDILTGVSINLSWFRIMNTALEEIPEGLFASCSRVMTLTLTGNRLRSLKSLRGLDTLANFNVEERYLEHLSDDIFEPTKSLRGVHITGSMLTNLPGSLCGLLKLEALSVHENRIRSINFGCFARLSSLQSFLIAGNQLIKLEFLPVRARAEISVDNLEEIMVNASSHNSTVEGRLSGLNTTASKDLDPSPATDRSRNDSQSTSEPDYVFSRMENLQRVDLSRNRLAYLPPNLFVDSVRLRSLLISNNFVTSVPESLLSGCTRLLRLDLSGNRIRTLGATFFSGLIDLEHIDLSDNSIEVLPDEIFRPFINITAPKRSWTITRFVLNLEGNVLTSLPVISIPRLTELNLARNRLTHLPVDTLRYTTNLERINVSYNHIQTTEPSTHVTGGPGTPIFHSNLRKLFSIDLSNNRLSRHPDIALVACSVRSLNLSGNQIEHVPFDGDRTLSYRYKTLEVLDLSHNGLQDNLVPRIGDFTRIDCFENVKHLDLSWNGIIILQCPENPAVINPTRCVTFLKRSQKLEVLLMAHNQIEVIPVFLQRLPKLRIVDLRHNKIKRVYHEDFFFVIAVTEEILRLTNDSERNYLKKGDLYELPNTRNLSVDLRYNEITYVELPHKKMRRVPRNCNVDLGFARATLFLGHNPIVCSCQVFTLLQYSLKEIRPVWEDEIWSGQRRVLPMTLDIKHLSCWAPSTVRGKNVSDPETWAHHLLPLMGLCQFLQRP